MSFSRYPEYKDSGVDWLGEIPAHWSVAALNYRYEVQLGKMLDEKRITGEHLAPYLRNVDVQWNRVNVDDLPQMDFSGDDIGRYGLRTGDLLVCEGGEVGRSAIWSGLLDECFYQKALHRLRARHAATDQPRFQMYLLRAAADLGIFIAAEGKSTIPHLTAEALRRYRLAYPPIEEQAAITTFLDRETAKIDALVAEQEKLIALLKEKRQAAISHAVTKGLDPDVPMKESGVEWLGEVPEHWDVVRLGFLTTRIGSGKTPLGGSETYTESGVLFIRSQNVYDEGLRLEDVAFINEETDAEMAWSRVEPGDILLNITGASLGRTCLTPDDLERANVNQHVCVIRLSDFNSRQFVSAAMKSASVKAQIDAAQTGAAREGLNFEQISGLRLALPPSLEQQSIAAHLEGLTTGIDALISEAARAVDLLRERRAALISAAVTGQIDVRGLTDTGVRGAHSAGVPA